MAFQTNFKPARSSKVERRLRRTKLKTAEDNRKKSVRLRDRWCRFPLCGCRKFGLALHVSHSKHKGIGGNPAGDRSDPALMVYVCSGRHRELRLAIDRGTVRWRALTPDGAHGPIAWDVDGEALQPFGAHIAPVVQVFVPHGWVEVARESGVQVLEALEDWQRTLLLALAQMSC